MNKSEYRLLCKAQSLPVFMQAWWWDALCGDAWDVLLVKDSQQRIAAALPYRVRRHIGFSLMDSPPFTVYTGPYIAPSGSEKQYNIYGVQHRYLSEIFELAKAKNININLQLLPSIDNPIALRQLGFRISHRFTYIIRASDEATLWANLNRNVKRNINEAALSMKVTESQDVAACHKVLSRSFEKNKNAFPIGLSQFSTLHEACKSNDSSKILLAHTLDGEVKAAAYLVWDTKYVYLLMSGGAPADLKTGALQLLFWSAIKEAQKQGKTLDFDGSMLENVEIIIRAFGGERVPKVLVEYYPNWIYGLLRALKG